MILIDSHLAILLYLVNGLRGTPTTGFTWLLKLSLAVFEECTPGALRIGWMLLLLLRVLDVRARLLIRHDCCILSRMWTDLCNLSGFRFKIYRTLLLWLTVLADMWSVTSHNGAMSTYKITASSCLGSFSYSTASMMLTCRLFLWSGVWASLVVVIGRSSWMPLVSILTCWFCGDMGMMIVFNYYTWSHSRLFTW